MIRWSLVRFRVAGESAICEDLTSALLDAESLRWSCGPMDKASAHGARDCRFESYQDQRRSRLRGQDAAAKVVISQVEAVKNELQFGDESPRVSSLGSSEYEARSLLRKCTKRCVVQSSSRTVKTNNSICPQWSHSSVGQSVRLITLRSAAQARVGPRKSICHAQAWPCQESLRAVQEDYRA